MKLIVESVAEEEIDEEYDHFDITQPLEEVMKQGK